MKVLDAFWDTRSLGVRSAELEIVETDTIDAIDYALSSVEEYQYVVAKVAAGCAGSALYLQSKGFAFIESSIEVEADLGELSFPRFVERFDKYITCRKASSGSEHSILSHVAEGLFTTDRVYLDPSFNDDLAASRYINWIKDEQSRGAELFHVYYKDDEVGFFVYKESVPGVEAYPFLAGLYNDWKSSGLGANVVVAIEMKEAQRRGCKRLRTFVSSNNLPILKIHELLGCRIRNIRNVFIKHA